MVHDSDEAKRIPWLNYRIKQIGFILSSLSDEDASEFKQSLETYGLDFQKTPSGTIVHIKNLQLLLDRISQEYISAREAAIAA